MQKSKSYRIVTSGLFVAIGLILPYFTAHAFGLPGTVLLPMHIPVLLCAAICGPYYGAASGVIIPALSCLLTGMPPLYPMLPMMAAQLFTMGLLTGLTLQRLKLPVYAALPLSMAAGWGMYGLAYAVLLFAGNGELRALSVTAALAQGIPGIAVQLLLIPAVLFALNRYQGGGRADDQQDGTLPQALHFLENGRASCVVIRGGAIIHTADGRGVSPLLKLYNDEPDKLKESLVVDKIIGKAAAMILVLGGVSRVYGRTMSIAAREYLTKHGVEVQYGRCVDMIMGRDQKGICPIEKSVLDTEDPREGLARMTAAIRELMKSAG